MSKEKNDTDKNMILVEAGRFEMGGKSSYIDITEKKHLVTISNDYYICKYPVTFAEYDEFCEATGKKIRKRKKKEKKKKPSDEYWGRSNRPVINISWYDAIEYCNWKSRNQNGLEEVYTIDKSVQDINSKSRTDKIKWTVSCNFDKNGYRLPTEAEWEFAARGGNESKGFIYSGSNKKNEIAWYEENSDNKTHPVGEKLPNELGIYDMNGNVEEWCWDWYSDSNNNSETYDPKGSSSGSYRVRCGGSYWHFGFGISDRHEESPFLSNNYTGFRVTRTH